MKLPARTPPFFIIAALIIAALFFSSTKNEPRGIYIVQRDTVLSVINESQDTVLVMVGDKGGAGLRLLPGEEFPWYNSSSQWVCVQMKAKPTYTVTGVKR